MFGRLANTLLCVQGLQGVWARAARADGQDQALPVAQAASECSLCREVFGGPVGEAGTNS